MCECEELGAEGGGNGCFAVRNWVLKCERLGVSVIDVGGDGCGRHKVPRTALLKWCLRHVAGSATTKWERMGVAIAELSVA